ncbi:MAG TPA: OmpH family outer membrane protein [Spirochaetota bacterium]|nr:MAG: Outer membrane protein (OmpH-like) [Spirochaetes bacterium ADurb.Bin133]HNZ26366.1 OmpH family outer membrane protein [Spirochaetota bacterium]HOF01200.1 OmpH family outer membrane protein [Spirochaetota bacterium]HOS32847.1 OmpH family outer membrane protein [Spirochaetota bacterium]HOS55322.1 OmpH family outer membrane protein [Spirochaetota bacterium]
MKRNLIILILSIMSLFFAYSSNIKIDRVGIINLDLILETVFSGKSKTMQDIKKEKNEFETNLKKIEENVMILKEASLKEEDQQKKLIIEKKIEEVTKQYNDYYKLKSYQIEQKIKKIQGPIIKEIYDTVRKLSEQEGFTLILDAKNESVFYYSFEADITQKIIDIFVKNYDN